MNQDREDELFSKRLNELSQQAYNRGICVYTSFLNLNELNLFEQFKNTKPGISYEMWGGYQEAERRVICFYEDDSFTNVCFPISCIKIAPISLKYGEKLNHRDYLGAILNLGIDRSKIGDIVIDDKYAYVFCMKEIGAFVCDNLTRVRHTNITPQVVEIEQLDLKLKTETISGTVTSVRLDALLSLAFKSSRSSLTGLIAGGKVFVNAKLITSNSFVPKENDIISVRGMGRFIYRRVETQTKKNKYRVILEHYI